MDQNAPVPNHAEVRVETYYRPTGPTMTTPAPLETPVTARRRHGPRWFIWLIGCMLAVLVLALLMCALVGGLLVGIAIKLSNEVTASATSTQTFAVNGVPSLDIHDQSGQVQVRPGASGSVTVQITKVARESSESAARAGLEKIVVNTSQTGNHIAITTDFGNDGFFANSDSVNLLITVPARANVGVDVTAGAVEIDGLNGLMDISGGAVTVALQDVVLTDGSRIHIATGSALVHGSQFPGAALDITVSTGNVMLQLPVDTQTRLDAQTNAGSIRITGWPLQPERMNRAGMEANGPLGAQVEGGGAIHVRVDAGDITISQI